MITHTRILNTLNCHLIYDSDLRATHAGTLLPAALTSVSFGFVFFRVRILKAVAELCFGRKFTVFFSAFACACYSSVVIPLFKKKNSEFLSPCVISLAAASQMYLVDNFTMRCFHRSPAVQEIADVAVFGERVHAQIRAVL